MGSRKRHPMMTQVMAVRSQEAQEQVTPGPHLGLLPAWLTTCHHSPLHVHMPCVCTHKYLIHIYTQPQTHMHVLCVHANTPCLHTCTHVCIPEPSHIPSHKGLCVYTHVCTHTQDFLCIQAHRHLAGSLSHSSSHSRLLRLTQGALPGQCE